MFEVISIFYFGVLAQAYLMIRNTLEKGDGAKFLLAIGAGIFAMIPAKREHVYDPYLHLFLVAVFFSAFFGVLFKKKILQVINKEVLLIWNMILMYILLKSNVADLDTLLIVIGFLSLPTLLNLFFNLDKTYAWRVFLYVWFLITIILIACSHISFDSLAFFFHKGVGAPQAGLPIFWIGASFFCVVINAWYVLDLIPLPDKRHTRAQTVAMMKADMALLASRYKTEDKNILKSVVLLSFVMLILTVNYFLNLVTDTVLVTFLITTIPTIDRFVLKSTKEKSV